MDFPLRFSLLLFALVSSLEAKDDVAPCGIPSRWCRDEIMARRCGVEEFCKTNVLNLTVYMESLCPDTQHFITTQLYPTFQKLYSSKIFTVQFVPYGKAKERWENSHWVFSCQHGPEECYGNLIETCTIHHVKDVKKIVPFMYCMMINSPNKYNAKKCAEQGGFDYTEIDNCVSGTLGNKLEHGMALKTNNLQPPLTFVPWITINGDHTYEMQTSALAGLAKYLCSIYKGPKPSVCQDFS